MQTSRNDRRLGLSWAVASAVGGAFMVVPWKLANEIGTPANSVLILLAVAAILNSALVAAQRIRSGGFVLRAGRIEFGVAAALATFTLLGNLASARAIQDLSPALLNVVMRVDVIFVAVLGWLLLDERVERRFWIGAAIAMLGLIVLQGPVLESGTLGLLESGTGMGIAAAACFSGLAIVTRRFIHQIDPVAVNAIRLWFSVAFWFGVYGLPRFSEIPRQQILYASLAAFTGPFLSRLALMISARHIEARLTTLASLSSPVMTLVIAFVLLSDWPRSHELVGGAIMTAGIAIPFLRIGRRIGR